MTCWDAGCALYDGNVHDDAVGRGQSHGSLRVCSGLLCCDRSRQRGLVCQPLLLAGRCVGIGAAADEGTNGEREAGARAPASPDPFYARQRAAPRRSPASPANGILRTWLSRLCVFPFPRFPFSLPTHDLEVSGIGLFRGLQGPDSPLLHSLLLRCQHSLMRLKQPVGRGRASGGVP